MNRAAHIISHGGELQGWLYTYYKMAGNQGKGGKGQRLAESADNTRPYTQEVQVRHPSPEPLSIPPILANRLDMHTPEAQYFMRAAMIEGDLNRRFRGDAEEAPLDIMSLCKQNPDSDQVFARTGPCFKGGRAPKTITASVARGTTSISFDTTLAVGCTCGCETVVVTYHYHLAQLHFKASTASCTIWCNSTLTLTMVHRSLWEVMRTTSLSLRSIVKLK